MLQHLTWSASSRRTSAKPWSVPRPTGYTAAVLAVVTTPMMQAKSAPLWGRVDLLGGPLARPTQTATVVGARE